MIISKVEISNKTLIKPMVTINNEDFDPKTVLKCINELKKTVGYSSYTCTFTSIEEYKIYRFFLDNNISYILKQEPDERRKEAYYTDEKGVTELTELEEYINLRVEILNNNGLTLCSTRAEEIKDIGQRYGIDFSPELVKAILKWSREEVEFMLKMAIDNIGNDLHKNTDTFCITYENVDRITNYLNEFYIDTVNKVLRTQYDKPATNIDIDE